MPHTAILLIDDHALFRTGLAMVLKDGMPDIALEQVASLEEALQGELQTPDVVLLDVQLQGLSGLEGISLVKRRWPLARVVMLSSMAEPRCVQLALERGAAAFVSKADTAADIVSVISSLVQGGAGACPANSGTVADAPDAQRLTPRQTEVLDLLCQGLSNKVIARRMNLSENTVRGHVQAMLLTLGVSSRTEAAFAARRSGLIL